MISGLLCPYPEGGNAIRGFGTIAIGRKLANRMARQRRGLVSKRHRALYVGAYGSSLSRVHGGGWFTGYFWSVLARHPVYVIHRRVQTRVGVYR